MSLEWDSFKRHIEDSLSEDSNSGDDVDDNTDHGPRQYKESRLIEAVRNGLSSTLSLFEEVTDVNDLDIKATDNFQRNAFHIAVSKPDTLKKLLEKLAEVPSVEDVLKQQDHEGEAPIHHAAIGANVESLKVLHDYKPSLMKLKTRNRKSVLHLAVMSRSVVAVNFVLSKDLDLITCKDNMSKTPVHEAATLKQVGILELLISKKSCTKWSDANGQLPIHIAASNGLRNTVEVLLREDPDAFDKVDNSGQSPILLAAKNGFPKLVSYLLDKKSNFGLQDNCTPKRTAFDWAVKLKHAAVVKVFLNKLQLQELKEVKKYSAKDGPEECLTTMVEREPGMARMLLDKCVDKKSSEITYEFFCLESKDKKSNCPQFKGLQAMIDNNCETCLRHPVVKKYVDVKWRNRGLKCTVMLILTKLLFHVSLMVYTTLVIGRVTSASEIGHDGNKHVVITRDSTPPNAAEMVALRVIIVIIAVGDLLRELVKVFTQPSRYIRDAGRYYKIVMLFSVMFYMFPVRDTLTVKQIAYGAVAVFLSWLNLMQVLKLIPVLGVYIILVEKVFWSVAKVFFVVVIYLLSFASTFYILLAEHYTFRNINISFVSTFVSMMNGLDYDGLFVAYGWHPGIYELKMFFLFLFVLIMGIVVNNALIGLAVGDTNNVMKSAKYDKFRRRAEFIIRLEKVMNKIPFFKSADVLNHNEPRNREKSFFQKFSDFFLSSQVDDGVVVDEKDGRNRSQLEAELAPSDDNVDKAIEVKLENLYTRLHQELSGIRDELKNLERH